MRSFFSTATFFTVFFLGQAGAFGEYQFLTAGDSYPLYSTCDEYTPIEVPSPLDVHTVDSVYRGKTNLSIVSGNAVTRIQCKSSDEVKVVLRWDSAQVKDLTEGRAYRLLGTWRTEKREVRKNSFVTGFWFTEKQVDYLQWPHKLEALGGPVVRGQTLKFLYKVEKQTLDRYDLKLRLPLGGKLRFKSVVAGDKPLSAKQDGDDLLIYAKVMPGGEHAYLYFELEVLDPDATMLGSAPKDSLIHIFFVGEYSFKTLGGKLHEYDRIDNPVEIHRYTADLHLMGLITHKGNSAPGGSFGSKGEDIVVRYHVDAKGPDRAVNVNQFTLRIEFPKAMSKAKPVAGNFKYVKLIDQKYDAASSVLEVTLAPSFPHDALPHFNKITFDVDTQIDADAPSETWQDIIATFSELKLGENGHVYNAPLPQNKGRTRIWILP